MSGLSSVYPPPPSNYKHFTDENISKLLTWRQNQTSQEMNILSDMMSDSFHKIDDDTPAGSSPASKQKDNDIPTHPLELLIPPTPPVNGTYRSFGNIWYSDDKLLSLSDMGIKQLYTLESAANKEQLPAETDEIGDSKVPDFQDRIFELKKLLNSLLVQFVELAGIMSISPESFPEKTEDIRVILINIHHLLNEYRPHQSRESLILLVEDELSAKKKDIGELKKTNDDIRKKISDLASQFKLMVPSSDTSTDEGLLSVVQSPKAVVQQQNVDQLQWKLLEERPT